MVVRNTNTKGALHTNTLNIKATASLQLVRWQFRNRFSSVHATVHHVTRKHENFSQNLAYNEISHSNSPFKTLKLAI